MTFKNILIILLVVSCVAYGGYKLWGSYGDALLLGANKDMKNPIEKGLKDAEANFDNGKYDQTINILRELQFQELSDDQSQRLGILFDKASDAISAKNDLLIKKQKARRNYERDMENKKMRREALEEPTPKAGKSRYCCCVTTYTIQEDNDYGLDRRNRNARVGSKRKEKKLFRWMPASECKFKMKPSTLESNVSSSYSRCGNKNLCK